MLEERVVPVYGFTPAQIRHAFGLDYTTYGSIVGDGTGQTIAIVDAGDDPSFVSSTDPNFASSDLAQFDSYFGLPNPPSFIKVAADGTTNYPAVDPGWPGEEALDVEWAHAIAPMANIMLIETPDDTTLLEGVTYAESLPNVSVVSMSFGGGGDGTAAENALFTTPSGHEGMTFIEASGDNGFPNGPNYPNVIYAGGISLTLNGNNTINNESGWSGSGGSISATFSQPSYQAGVYTSAWRTTPDVSFLADPNTGVAVYDSYDNGTANPWSLVGGTSLATPCWAGIIAIADQFRVDAGKGTLDGPSDTLPALYGIPNTTDGVYGLPYSDFHDITTGNNGEPAGPGYDLVTGLGTPYANLVINDLAGVNGNLEYYAPNSGTNVMSLQLSNGFIEILDNGSVVEEKPVATTTSVIINGAIDETNTLDVSAAFNALGTVPLDFIGADNGQNTLTIEGTSAANSFVVQPTSVLLNGNTITYSNTNYLILNGNAGSDTFDVTPPDDTTVTVNGGTQGATLDYHVAGTVTYTGTGSGTITASGYPTFYFTGITSVTTDNNLVYYGPSTGANSFTVLVAASEIEIEDNGVLVASKPIANTSAVVIHGGANVQNAVEALYSFESLSIPLDFIGGAGTQNSLQIEGSLSAENFAITPTTVTLAGNVETYSNVQTLTIDGNGGGDTFNIIPSATTTIDVNGGYPYGNITYQGAGALSYTGSDSGTIVATGYSTINFTGISSTLITGQLIYFAPSQATNSMSLQLSGSNIEIVNDGTVAVSAPISLTTAVIIYGGNGVDNDLTVGADFNALTIPLTFNGGTGGSNTLQLQGPTGVADSFIANATSVIVNGKTIDYTGTQSLILNGSTVGNTFAITPSSSTAIAVNGSGSSNSLNYAGTGSLTPAGVGSGTISTSGLQTVTFTGINGNINFANGYELIVNGPVTYGTDTYQLIRSGSGVAVSINGVNPLANLTGQLAGVAIEASSDNSNLIFNNSAGIVNANVVFVGGGGNNTIQVTGASSQTLKRQTLKLSGAGAGELILDPDNSAGAGDVGTLDSLAGTITFTGAATIADTSTANEFDYFGVGGSQSITLMDGGTVAGSQALEILSTSSASAETVDVANAGTVTVNGEGGASTFTLNSQTAATGLKSLAVYGNELTGGSIHTNDTAAETFIVNSTAAGMATTVTAGGGSASFAITGSGLKGNVALLGNSSSNSFILNAGAGIPAASLNISGVGSAANNSLVVNGVTGGSSMTLKIARGAFGENLAGLGATLGFDTIGSVTINGISGVNSLTLLDGTGSALGGVTTSGLNLAAGILYSPSSSTTGNFRINVGYTGVPLTPALEPAISFTGINGSLSVNGGNTGAKDTLTVLGISALGNSSSLYDEATASNPADKVTITDSQVQITNATLGVLRSVSIVPGTIANLVYRAGNKSSPDGDTITVTPSSKLNILIDGMSGKSADKLNILSTGIPNYSKVTTPSLGGSQIRVSQPNGASVGYTNLEQLIGGAPIAVGSDAGSAPSVRVYAPSNLSAPKWVLQPFSSSFKGGVRVAVGDVNGDGIPDIVCVSGAGADTDVVVYDGITGQQIMNFIAFTNYLGGATVAVGDTNGDGYGDIIVGTSQGSSHVKVFSGKDGSLLQSFLAFAPGYLGGVNVAAGNIDGSGDADIIVGAASGTSPAVEVFNGSTLSLERSFLAFAAGSTNGITVAAGDVNGDGISDIVVGASTGSPLVRVFDGATNNLIANFTVPSAGTSTSGVRVGVDDIDGTSTDQVMVVLNGSSVIDRYRIVPNVAAETPFQTFPTPLSGVFIGSL